MIATTTYKSVSSHQDNSRMLLSHCCLNQLVHREPCSCITMEQMARCLASPQLYDSNLPLLFVEVTTLLVEICQMSVIYSPFAMAGAENIVNTTFDVTSGALCFGSVHDILKSAAGRSKWHRLPVHVWRNHQDQPKGETVISHLLKSPPFPEQLGPYSISEHVLNAENIQSASRLPTTKRRRRSGAAAVSTPRIRRCYPV
jgi:hypothetical protein